MICTAAVMMLPLYMSGQETLTLDQCREMAIKNNKALDQARQQVELLTREGDNGGEEDHD